MKHTILGAGGSIGNALTYELLKTKADIRLVSRSGYYISGTESYKADLTSYVETLKSLRDSDIVYLCAGLPYDHHVWAELWPKIMQNTIDACKSSNAKLVFFDNVYMYGKVEGKMTEDTPYNPCSRKGEIRAETVLKLQTEISQRNINAIIARSADLYGPHATRSSVPYLLVFDRLLHGRRAQWLINGKKLHSLTFTLDAARGMLMLSKCEECYNQIWHLPTCSTEINGVNFIRLVAEEMGVHPNYTILRKWMLKMSGMFDKTISESLEMLYQSEYDYIFDSTRFNGYFKYKPVPYSAGIYETLEFIKPK